MKQFEEFEALVPDDFKKLMVKWWMEDESSTRDQVIKWYYDDDFKTFADRVVGTRCRFKPDLGYADKEKNGTICFEKEDNNYVIPVHILEVISQ